MGVCVVLSPLMIGGFLILGDNARPADALVILSGEEEERVQEAVYWYKENYAHYMVFTVTDSEDIGERGTHSQKLMRIAIDEGVPQDAMFLTEGEATSTIDEANAVLLLCKKRDIKSILVITSSYHTRRTKVIFEDIFKDSDISVRVHSVKDSWYQPWNWFLTEEGWQRTINEYGGLIYYYLNRT
jgi:uncharacterized SAM-binding protein YcdF (DUF218 family)